ncbi:TniQ protein [Tahibacter aquaticus]|uniref:TniQ protein n=1 Tax=Tahibacter aquaticus TaxID=520092 RepID=A0A4R6Z6H1_9GAMM|nr:TniQ protein [Tahibacter aquaticus]
MPACSGWTPLPPVRLRGIDTELIESLDHYAFRMASMCGVSRGFLASILRAGNCNAENKSIASGHTSWIGPRSNYAVLLFRLMELTGQDNLSRGTFHYASKVLSHRGMAYTKGGQARRRWCPTCYLEWDHETSFEPLVWAFSMLAVCPVHRVSMESTCPQCDAEQPLYRSYEVRRDCFVCRRPLGVPGKHTQASPISSWIDRSLIRFTAFVSNQDDILKISCYLEFCDVMKRRLRAGEPFPDGVRQFVDVTMRTSHVCIPTITQYLNLCAFQGCEIEDIFIKPRSAASRSLFDRSAGFNRIPFPKRPGKENLRRTGDCMIKLLASGRIRLPPLAFLCNQLGVWLDAVRDCYPDLFGRYSDVYSQQKDIARVHVLRVFDCASLHLRSATRLAAPDLKMIVAERARVSADLAAQCVEALLVIRQFLPTPNPDSEPNSQVPRDVDEDPISTILDKWMRGWK